MDGVYQAWRRLRGELAGWLEQSALLDPLGPHGGGEDEINYALAWLPYYQITADPAARNHFRRLLSALASWVGNQCFDGYPPFADAHHGPEPFVLFLPRFLGLQPGDETARAILEAAARPLVEPPHSERWYEPRRGVFRSYWLGTREVSDDPCWAYETADHLRFVHLALAAWRTSGDAALLDWATDYARRRAQRLLASDDPLPVLWTLDGRGLGEADLVTAEQRRMASAAHHAPDDPLAGVENLLASGAVYAFGDLYGLTGEEVFREAACRIVAPLVSEWLDPYGDPAAAALAYLRDGLGDHRFDEALAGMCQGIRLDEDDEWGLLVRERRCRDEPGVGRRADMLRWVSYRGHGAIVPSHEPSTAALALAWQLTGNPAFAARALAGAARKLALARRVLRGGREHADRGGAVCAVAAGHGRNWGVGAVTGCLGPLLLGNVLRLGREAPAIEVLEGRVRRLPETVVSLVRRLPGGRIEVDWFNGGETEAALSWRAGDSLEEFEELALGPGESRRSCWEAAG